MAFIGVNVQMKQGWSALARWGYLSDTDIYEGKWWGLITNAFVHMEPLHILFNMYWLWFLGRAFERTFGIVRFLLFVLVAAFVSSSWQLFSGNGGIGFSGVGYALFGFGWATRTRFPEMARVVNQRTVQMFLVWGVICVVATQAKIMNIGNVAHASGALFGYLLGVALVQSRTRVLGAAGALIVAMAAFVTPFYSPFSDEWLAVRAEGLIKSKHYSQSLPYLYRYVDIGADKQWGWANIAYVEQELGHHEQSELAVRELNRLDNIPDEDQGPAGSMGSDLIQGKTGAKR